MRTIIEDNQTYAVIPMNEWESVQEQLEDLQDMIDYMDAKARGEEGFPLALWQSISDGANPVKAFREYRGMTQETLAQFAGVKRPLISDIENGKKQGSINTLKLIAKALNVPLDALLDR